MGNWQRVAGITCIIMLTVTSYSGATFHPGERGNQIAAIQQVLGIVADGDYGSGTIQAVKNFQSSHGLDVDGIVGAQTYKAIMGSDIPVNNTSRFVQKKINEIADMGAASPASAISSDTVITVIQQALVNKGYNIPVDGDFGSVTEQAVRQFQMSQGLDADGIVGPTTFRVLTGRELTTGSVRRYSYSRSNDRVYSSMRDRVLGIANQYLGVPYVFGGNTPSGFDCSGFTRYVYSAVGIDLPRMADDQYAIGSYVSSSMLQPGDLVFFTTYASGVSHSGIYIGNDQFISATTSGGVAIANLHNSYWESRYIGAKRVIS
ncbi:MAG: NlpC/P60 family protein [Megasphaera sp.]|jgi:cell wall-associated NlpC family hydrolase|uniref:C40 family peptidase n=1 Tax=Megasphaera sueciensis TaxID=349094 RepID=UPI003CFE82B7|nr:NlpC/P60 family protein [Megasphaera sp.]MCI1823525.1 NlpC/P60 family protein [Megasphaera sp.]